jgi:rod shape determining protein RodA
MATLIGGRRSRGGMWRSIDWTLLLATLPIVAAGLFTMNSFASENYFFDKQIIWAGIALAVFFALALFDYHFLRRTSVIASLYVAAIVVLLLVFVFGTIAKGAQARFDFGSFALQPADPMKLVVILVLAKYFSRRHVEIAHIRHILVSGVYAIIPFILIFLQPDLGSAIILGAIWLGMVLVAGISLRHLLTVFLIAALVGAGLWLFALRPYQKQRVLTFIHPLTDIRGAGYNAFQSTVAVGSGQIFGKGVGYGTQSRLQFLPEYETDFIFAAFAEEWGFFGVLIIFVLYGIVLWRILMSALHGESNFEMLFASGLAIYFLSHLIIHIGFNVGLLPVTGITIPFMSYGGSHLLTEYAGLGILMGMRRYSRSIHKDDIGKEFLGV